MMGQPARGEPRLELSGVVVEVLGRRTLDDISLQARAGEVLLLAGRNGAGKTTLLHTALGLLRPATGVVRRGPGGDCGGMSGGDDLAPGTTGGTGVAFDTPALPPRSTARQAVELVAAYRRLARGGSWSPGRPARSTPAGRLEDDPAVQLLVGDILDVRCSRMSHGMRRRVSLAAALLGEPDLVVLDEPYNGLDPSSMAALSHLVGRAADRGAAVVVSTHYLAEFADLTDHHVVLEAGRVVLDSDHVEVSDRLRHCVDVSDTDAALVALRRAGLTAEPAAPAAPAAPVPPVGAAPGPPGTSREGTVDLWAGDRGEVGRAVRALTLAGVDVYAVAPGRAAVDEMVEALLAPPLQEGLLA